MSTSNSTDQGPALRVVPNDTKSLGKDDAHASIAPDARYSLGTDDPWPDQGMNKILTLAGDLNPSDVDAVDWLAMLLYLASKRADARDLAERALKIYGSMGRIFSRPSRELREMLGLDSTTTSILTVTKTCMKLILTEEFPARRKIDSYAALMNYLALDLRYADEERLRILYLDQKCRLIRDDEMARGTNDRASIYPKEIAKRAATYCASSVIIAHNHLADDPTPSPASIQATLGTKGALKLFDIVLQDHVIVARNRCLSMREEKMI